MDDRAKQIMYLLKKRWAEVGQVAAPQADGRLKKCGVTSARMSLAETTKKLGVSFYAFVHDRISKLGYIPPLAEIIRARAAPA